MGNPYAPPDPNRPAPPPRPPAPPDAAAGPTNDPRPVIPPEPVGTASARQLVRTAVMLLIAGLIVTLLPLPWALSSLAFTGLALVVALRGAIVGARAHAGRGVVGSAFIMMLAAGGGLFVGSLSLLLLPAQLEYQQCQADALTVSAEHACTQAYQEAVLELQQRITGELPTDPATP